MRKLPFRRTANRIEWRLQNAASEGQVQISASGRSSLLEQVGRKKARWLKRVMYETGASSTAKCFAYAVFDHLNCVTMDCWPAQLRLTYLLGRKSTKTAQRAARELERLGVLVIKRDSQRRLRYAPIFIPDDEDKPDASTSNNCRIDADKKDRESYLSNLHQKGAPTARASGTGRRPNDVPRYDPAARGTVEIKVAAMLGEDGITVLQKLGEYDDRSVDRLCRAYVEGSLTKRELTAARLAADQLPVRWAASRGSQATQMPSVGPNQSAWPAESGQSKIIPGTLGDLHGTTTDAQPAREASCPFLQTAEKARR